MDRLAIVTGASRGIGAELAVELLERGWRVESLARGPADARLAEAPERAVHSQVDLADGEALERWAREGLAERAHPERCDVVALVNNAGILAPVHPVAGIDRAELERAFRVNAVAPIWLAGYLLERRPRGRTVVASLSSGAAHSPFPGWAAYCATKAALAMADRVTAVEHEADSARRISVVSYAPGVVATGMQAEIRATEERLFPRRARFVELYQQDRLVPPRAPARQLADLIESPDLPHYLEAHYTPPEGG